MKFQTKESARRGAFHFIYHHMRGSIDFSGFDHWCQDLTGRERSMVEIELEAIMEEFANLAGEKYEARRYPKDPIKYIEGIWKKEKAEKEAKASSHSKV